MDALVDVAPPHRPRKMDVELQQIFGNRAGGVDVGDEGFRRTGARNDERLLERGTAGVRTESRYVGNTCVQREGGCEADG